MSLVVYFLLSTKDIQIFTPAPGTCLCYAKPVRFAKEPFGRGDLACCLARELYVNRSSWQYHPFLMSGCIGFNQICICHCLVIHWQSQGAKLLQHQLTPPSMTAIQLLQAAKWECPKLQAHPRGQHSVKNTLSLIYSCRDLDACHHNQNMPGNSNMERVQWGRNNLTTFSLQVLMISSVWPFSMLKLTPIPSLVRDLTLTGLAGRKQWITSWPGGSP